MHKLAFWSELESMSVGRLDVRRDFYTQRVVRCWHSCGAPWRCSRTGWMGAWAA